MAMDANGNWYEGRSVSNSTPITRGVGSWMNKDKVEEAEKADFYANNPSNYIYPAGAQNDPRGTMAEILRGQWKEFETTTVPIIKQLEGMTTYAGNTGVVDALKTEARQNAKASFGNVVTDANRQAASLGMSLSPTTQGALERSAKLGQAAAEVDGVNRATQYQQDLNRQIVAGQNLSSLNRN